MTTTTASTMAIATKAATLATIQTTIKRALIAFFSAIASIALSALAFLATPVSLNAETYTDLDSAIAATLIHMSKGRIVSEALRLGVPLNLTWSCYQNEEKACGVCESYRLRLKGFALAKVVDPIAYEAR
jgi:hypothetical protein